MGCIEKLHTSEWWVMEPGQQEIQYIITNIQEIMAEKPFYNLPF